MNGPVLEWAFNSLDRHRISVFKVSTEISVQLTIWV